LKGIVSNTDVLDDSRNRQKEVGMDKKLLAQAVIKFVFGIILVGVLVFLPAGTFGYLQGWVFMGCLFIPILIMGLVMLFRAPELLRKRLDGKEKEGEQKTVVLLSGIMFLTGFLLCGLDYRFGWMQLPLWISITAAVLFLAGYVMYAEVMRENAYLSRTIEVQQGQKVIDTGLYGVVRHPMYTATLLLFLMIPLVLGSLIDFAMFFVYPFIIAKRIKNEEAVLEKGLEGYCEYKQRVKYRLIPFVW